MRGWMGDDSAHIRPLVFADADFAGCMNAARSTSCVFLRLRGLLRLRCFDDRYVEFDNFTPLSDVVHACEEPVLLALVE